MDRTLSKTFDIWRFLMLLGVILIHSFILPREMSISRIDFDNFKIDYLYSLIVSYSYVWRSLSVPSFFFISGFLFFYSKEQFGYSLLFKKLRRRIFSILIPFVLWIIIAYLYPPLKQFIISLFVGDFQFDTEYFKSFTLRIFWDENTGKYPIVCPLWYLRDLLVLFVISPVIYFLLKKIKVFFLFILLLSYLMNLWPNYVGFSIDSLFFFTLGSFFTVSNFDVNKIINHTKILFFVSLFLSIFSLFFYSFWDKIFVIVGLFFVMSLIYKLVQKNLISIYPILPKSVFFVYALHGFAVTGTVMNLLEIIIPNNSNWFLLTLRYFSVPFITAAICILLYYILSKICPRVLRVLTGTR